MINQNEQSPGLSHRAVTSDNYQTQISGVSWGAIFAGSAAAAVLSLVLLVLGTGLGFSLVSPWAHNGIGATTFGITTILWVTLTSLLASGMGGYLAGRLRTKWIDVHKDEVYFRDTAHGFLAWAVATLATATLLTSAIGSIVSGGLQASASMAGGVASTAMTAAGGAMSTGSEMMKSDANNGPMGYFVDSLFRRDMAGADLSSMNDTERDASKYAATNGSSSEVTRILRNALHTGELSENDVQYISQLVAQRTGQSPQDAKKRVNDIYAQLKTTLNDAELAAREAADKARKASAYAALWLFISLFLGAFIASWMATYGGRRRDA
jgi:hypothetical protein